MPSPVAPPRSRRNRKRAEVAASSSLAYASASSSSAHHRAAAAAAAGVGTDLAPRRATDYQTGPHTLDHNIGLFGERLGYNVQRCIDLRTRVETRKHALERLQDEEADLREEVNQSHARVAEESERLDRTRHSVEKHRQQAQEIHDDIDAAVEEHEQHTVHRDAQIARKVAAGQHVLALHRTLDDQEDQLVNAR